MKTLAGRFFIILGTVGMTTQAANIAGEDLPRLSGEHARKPLAPHEKPLLIKADWEEYTGTFDFADFPSMAIYVSNGELYGETSHGKSVLKKATQPDSFEIVDYQGTLQFNRDKHRKIISVELNAQGFTSTGVKRKKTD